MHLWHDIPVGEKAPEDEENVLQILHSNEFGKEASVIGEIVDKHPGKGLSSETYSPERMFTKLFPDDQFVVSQRIELDFRPAGLDFGLNFYSSHAQQNNLRKKTSDLD